MLTRRELLAALGAAPFSSASGQTKDTGESLIFARDRRTLFEYRYTSAKPKTYIHPIYLNDTPITRDAPADHVHHRGLMLAWSKVNGDIDFWGEANPGKHGQIVQASKKAGRGHVDSTNDWTAEGRTLLRERRRIRVLPAGPDQVFLEWRSRFEAIDDTAELGSKGHPYNGLGVRLAESMDGGAVLNANGTTTIEKANGEPALWCAYYGKAPWGQGACGVAIFDHPANPRHPSPFFVMKHQFGYLSAAPTFHDPVITVRRGRPVEFRWAVAAFPGEPTAEGMAAFYAAWSKA